VFLLRIIPPQLGLYMSLAPEMKLTYPLGGPAAQTAFEQGLQGFEARAFRGLGVFTSTPVSLRRTRRPTRPSSLALPSFPLVPLAVRGLRRPGLRADAAALLAGRRVLPHVAAAGLRLEQAASGELHG
jgi:hypothetical protein